MAVSVAKVEIIGVKINGRKGVCVVIGVECVVCNALDSRAKAASFKESRQAAIGGGGIKAAFVDGKCAVILNINAYAAKCICKGSIHTMQVLKKPAGTSAFVGVGASHCGVDCVNKVPCRVCHLT